MLKPVREIHHWWLKAVSTMGYYLVTIIFVCNTKQEKCTTFETKSHKTTKSKDHQRFWTLMITKGLAMKPQSF